MYSADAHFTLAKTATNRARYPFSFLVCLVIEEFVVFFLIICFAALTQYNK